MPPSPLLVKQTAWQDIKQGIASGRFQSSHVEHLLKALNPDNNNVSFKKLGAALIKTVNGSGKNLMVPGFEMQVSLPPNVALLLSRSLQLKGTLFQFKAQSTFKKNDDDSILLTVRTAEPAPESPDDIHNIRHLMDADVERFARYSLLRGVAQALAFAGVIKPSPQTKAPLPITHYPTDKNEFWDVSAQIYLKDSIAITNILSDSLSKMDLDKINELFSLSLQTPKRLPPPPSPKEPVITSPRPPMATPSNYQPAL